MVSSLTLYHGSRVSWKTQTQQQQQWKYEVNLLKFLCYLPIKLHLAITITKYGMYTENSTDVIAD